MQKKKIFPSKNRALDFTLDATSARKISCLVTYSIPRSRQPTLRANGTNLRKSKAHNPGVRHVSARVLLSLNQL